MLYLQGKKGFLRQVGYLAPILLMMGLMNPMFNHEGVTVLWYLPNDNPITLEAVSTQKKAPAGILAAAFPTAKRLEGRYPWLKKQPWLLPVAWTSRMANYLRETKRRPDSSLADALKIGAERVELLKRYDIL